MQLAKRNDWIFVCRSSVRSADHWLTPTCDRCMCPGGVGGCLEQRQDDGTIRPVGFASRALMATQLKWDVSRIEAWCIVFMLRYFYWAMNPKLEHYDGWM